jgi:hypothetical protein
MLPEMYDNIRTFLKEVVMMTEKLTWAKFMNILTVPPIFIVIGFFL